MQGLSVARSDRVSRDCPIARVGGLVLGPGFALHRSAGFVWLAAGLDDGQEARALAFALAFHLRQLDEPPMRRVAPETLGDFPPVCPCPAQSQLN